VVASYSNTNGCGSPRWRLIRDSCLDTRAAINRFLLTLIESGVEVLFADFPEVTGALGKFILTQMAAVAGLED
jgi:hypothetical protein